MLKTIPRCISPELMKVMMEMGHGDELVIADGDFPAHSCNGKVIRADGLYIEELLEAILKYFPLDPFVEKPVSIMAPVEESGAEPPCWNKYRDVIRKYDSMFTDFDPVERFQFYERTKNAFAVVICSEPDGNIILKKGVVNI